LSEQDRSLWEKVYSMFTSEMFVTLHVNQHTAKDVVFGSLVETPIPSHCGR